jgi:hypothetical protein
VRRPPELADAGDGPLPGVASRLGQRDLTPTEETPAAASAPQESIWTLLWGLIRGSGGASKPGEPNVSEKNRRA